MAAVHRMFIYVYSVYMYILRVANTVHKYTRRFGWMSNPEQNLLVIQFILSTAHVNPEHL